MSDRLKALAAEGTSPWLDNIRRGWLRSGEFARMVEDGILGVTSNPTIFQKAIADSDDYDEAIAQSARAARSAEEVFFELAIADVQEACDQIRSVYDDTGHVDGFVSFELPPNMANDTAASVAAAPRFWKRIDRPNLFIKIPGTAEGIPAIEESIAAGINVNVTLLFSLERHDEVHWAFIRGLERRVEQGLPIDDVHSVASFFVSRVDTAIDAQLPDDSPLRGRAAVANAKLAYQRYLGITGDRSLVGVVSSRRAGAAPVVGLDRDQEPGVLRRALRGLPDRTGLRQHHARGHDRGVLRSRHRATHGRREPG